jgi:type IV secretion system protein TrbI
MLRINGAFNGHINCLISIPIYSTGADHLLIPQYSLALGHTQAVSSQHQERLFVTFDKIIMPDGYTKEIDNSDGLDQIGQNGLKDKIDRHLARIFGTSLAIAAIGGLAQVGNGAVVTPFAEYRAGVTESVSQSSMQVLNHMLDTMPTMVIREGARNQIYVVRDFYLEDFYQHRIKGEM